MTYYFTHNGFTDQTDVVHIAGSQPGSTTVELYVTYLPEGGDPDTDTQRIDAEPVTITWSNP